MPAVELCWLNMFSIQVVITWDTSSRTGTGISTSTCEDLKINVDLTNAIAKEFIAWMSQHPCNNPIKSLRFVLMNS
jgi:hypothetical protein